MKTLVKYSLYCLIGCIGAGTMALVWAQEKPSEAIRVKTESKEEINKILAAVKGADKSTYRLTVVEAQADGKAKTKTYGSAPLDTVRKIGGGQVPVVGAGRGVAADDIIIIVKVITKGSAIRDRLMRNLDTKLSHIDKVDAR
jgi:hypothetical protein